MDRPVIPADVFPRLMPHHVVSRKQVRHALVQVMVVGHQLCFAGKIRRDDGEDLGEVHVIQHKATRLPCVTVNQGQHFVLVMEATATLLPLGLDGVVMPDVCLVHFHHATIRAERGEVTIAHRFPDPVRHEPCRLQRDPKRAVKLVGANSLLAAGDEENGLQPDVQRNVRCLENRADGDSERLAAVSALVDADPCALALELRAIPDHTALRAYRPVRPETRFYELVGGFLAMEVRGGEDGFHS